MTMMEQALRAKVERAISALEVYRDMDAFRDGNTFATAASVIRELLAMLTAESVPQNAQLAMVLRTSE